MGDLSLVVSLSLSSLGGAAVGFCAGLVPGLHMNNIAAGITAYSAAVLATFGPLAGLFGPGDPALLISCFISAALVGHMFAESITSTYLGIPGEDVVSVLPAHRLARAGLGEAAVRASADGTLSGVIVSALLLVPTCLMMGDPVGLYGSLSRLMGFIILVFALLLLYSEGSGKIGRRWLMSVLKGMMLFLSSGLLGTVVLCSNFNACAMPDLAFQGRTFVLRSSLLLPMFAGLFGVPGLILGIRSGAIHDCEVANERYHAHSPTLKDILLSFAGGSLVGWLPGMTSGSSATVCSPSVRDDMSGTDVRGSTRFIWLYSSISGAGAVFAVGALFIISRARSGSMDAAQYFLGNSIVPGSLNANFELIVSMVMSMIIAALFGHALVASMNLWFFKVRNTMCSAKVAVVSLIFVCSLSFVLTGTRGVLVMATAACLGLLPPLSGVRRIQLMGCLLVPIMLNFFGLV